MRSEANMLGTKNLPNLILNGGQVDVFPFTYLDAQLCCKRGISKQL